MDERNTDNSCPLSNFEICREIARSGKQVLIPVRPGKAHLRVMLLGSVPMRTVYQYPETITVLPAQ